MSKQRKPPILISERLADALEERGATVVSGAKSEPLLPRRIPIDLEKGDVPIDLPID